MGRLLLWQLLMLLLAVCISAWIWGISAMGSAVWGGLCYFLPTVAAIIVLTILKQNIALMPTALSVAEQVKLISVCVIMIVAYLTHQADNWLAFLSGLTLVSQAGLFTFGKRRVL